MVFADECWYKSLKPLMESVREQMGDMPVYLTFDIDGVCPTFCPGTGMYIIRFAVESSRACMCLKKFLERVTEQQWL